MICLRAGAFALGVALASVAQAETQQPLAGDIEIVPGGGSAAKVIYAPKFKSRHFAEGWCEGYKFAVQQSQRDHDDLIALTKVHKITPEVDELITSILDQAALPEMPGFTIETEDHQTVECK